MSLEEHAEAVAHELRTLGFKITLTYFHNNIATVLRAVRAHRCVVTVFERGFPLAIIQPPEIS